MKKIQFAAIRSLVLTLASLAASTAAAQQFEEAAPQDSAPAAAGESWSYRPATELSISKQKAMARGAQRMARMEAMRWYGFSASRPTAATMPYTTMYSPAWEMPGGRPFAWNAWQVSRRPVVIITEPTQAAVYR